MNELEEKLELRSAANLKLSKMLFFLAAFLSFALSIYLYFSGKKTEGIFVGIWVPSILSAGILFLVKPHKGDEL